MSDQSTVVLQYYNPIDGAEYRDVVSPLPADVDRVEDEDWKIEVQKRPDGVDEWETTATSWCSEKPEVTAP